MSTARHFDDPIAAPVAAGQWLHRPQFRRFASEAREAWRRSGPLLVIAALRVIPGPQRIVAYVMSMGYALLGRRQAIMALVLLWLCNMYTHAFGLPPGGAAIFRHLTVIAAAISVLVVHVGEQPHSRTPWLLAWTAILSILLLVHSMFLSTMPDVSALKAISFAMTIQLLLTAWSSLSPPQRAVTESQLFGVLYGLAVLSTPLVAVGRGYVRTGRGFQGLLEHPQAFGPTMAIVAVWLFAAWLTDRRMRFSLKVILGLSLAWIYLAKARIGLLVFLVGMATVMAAGPLAGMLNQSRRVPRLLKDRLAIVVASLLVIVAVAGSVLAEKSREFISKSGKSTSALEAAWESRGKLIESMQVNISQRPLTGIGLGVASNPDQFSAFVRDPYFGFVIMAAVEKGVLPVAIVEEFGWPLALLYAPWFVGLLVMSIRAGPRYAGVCAAALTMNLSEAVFFSPGGGGLIVLVLVTMAATAPVARGDHVVPRVAA